MKYAKEVIDLMGAYPGRFFKKSSIVRYVVASGHPDNRGTEEGVKRVIAQLMEQGVVRRVPDSVSHGKGYMYQWKTGT